MLRSRSASIIGPVDGESRLVFRLACDCKNPDPVFGHSVYWSSRRRLLKEDSTGLGGRGIALDRRYYQVEGCQYDCGTYD